MIMKKLFKSLFVIIAAMVTFAGCAKEEIAAPETKTVQFFAEEIATKTVFGTPDGTTYPTLWTANDEKVKVLINLNEDSAAAITVADDFKTATFNAEFKLDDEKPSVAPFTFYALTPASAYLGKNAERFSATIPNVQTPLENSVDEAAQILYAVSEAYEEFPSEVALHFNHFTAYGKLSFKNLELNGANVESVALTAEKNIAGRWNYMVADGTFTENSGSNAITINTTKTENIWFACAEADLSNTTLKVVVNTDKGPLTKEINLAAGHKFEAGKIAKFTVDMQGIAFGKNVVYELVTSATELTPESKVIIVAAEYDYALSTTQNSNNRAQASVKKSDDLLTITNPGDDVQVLTVEEGTVEGTVAFNTGAGYLYAASSGSNHLRTQTTLDANGSWLVTFADGVASVVAQGANTRNILRYNDGNSIFSCYGSGQKDVAIYKLQGSGTVLENYLKVSTTEINVAADATSATFTVSSDLEWEATASGAGVRVTTDGNTVTVSFAANTSTSEKVITVTVSADGVEPQTVTITQAKKITKTQLTVAEFKELPDNADDLYELTGEITGIYQAYNASYNNISFYLTDATGTITIFRMSCEGIDYTKVVVGNTITVKGAKTTYKENAQMAEKSVCLSLIEAEPTPDGGDSGDDDDNNGNTGGSDDNASSATISFADVANRTSQDTNSQVWKQNGITVTNEKGASTSNVADYSNPARFYKSSSLKVESATAMTKIDFACNNSSYAEALKNSITAGGTVSVSDKVVTVVLSTASTSFSIEKLGGQVRMDSITVYYGN